MNLENKQNVTIKYSNNRHVLKNLYNQLVSVLFFSITLQNLYKDIPCKFVQQGLVYWICSSSFNTEKLQLDEGYFPAHAWHDNFFY
jgi:hypothetical protein